MLQTTNRLALEDTQSLLDFDRLRAAPVVHSPYDYVLISDFIRPQWQDPLIAAYPEVKKGGSFPLSTVQVNASFGALIDAMNSETFRQIVEEKFDVDLTGRPTMFTVRGRCRRTDGKIHTDTESKIITVLLYMNPRWQDDGGRLRLLRSGTDIEDVAAEIPPTVGTLLIFKRSDKSFHGHLPFDGERKVVQMNWVTHQKFVDREAKRHRRSAFFKLLGMS